MLSSLGLALPCACGQGNSAVGGVVRDVHGAPQMGALIELIGPDATVVARTYTDDHGRYVLKALPPGQYAIRASAAFLLPTLHKNLHVRPGMRALANLTISAMMEAGVWFPTQRRGSDESSDDWRWTLRSAANRPLLRVLGGDESSSDPVSSSGSLGSSPSAPERSSTPDFTEHLALMAAAGIFAQSGTHQILTFGFSTEHGQTEVLQADLGQPNVGGEVATFDGHAGLERSTGIPGGETRLIAGFSQHPEIAGGSGVGLQAFTLASGEKMALGDAVMIDAGTLLSAERLVASRVTAAPYLRVVVSPNDHYAVMYRFASQREMQSADDLDHLQAGPEWLSDAAGRPMSSNGAHQEIALAHHDGGDLESLAIYQDNLQVAALEGLGATRALRFAGLPVLADTSTGRFRIAEKGYTARGVRASWTHQLAPKVNASLAVALGSALHTKGVPLSVEHLDNKIEVRVEPVIDAAVNGRMRTGTAYRVQYRWQPKATVDSVDAYNTKIDTAYLGCSLKQKLWSGHRLQGLDAVIEATNLLEEGYKPMLGPDGQTLILAQAPRALQAGLAFSF